MQLEGFGFYCGCEYCREELKASIYFAEEGLVFRNGRMVKEQPREVPKSWNEAMK